MATPRRLTAEQIKAMADTMNATIRLTPNEMRIAKRLGITYELYAKELAKTDPSWATNWGDKEKQLEQELKALGANPPEKLSVGGHQELCTCWACNTDIDCKQIALESKNKAEYDKTVKDVDGIGIFGPDGLCRHEIFRPGRLAVGAEEHLAHSGAPV